MSNRPCSLTNEALDARHYVPVLTYGIYKKCCDGSLRRLELDPIRDELSVREQIDLTLFNFNDGGTMHVYNTTGAGPRADRHFVTSVKPSEFNAEQVTGHLEMLMTMRIMAEIKKYESRAHG